MAKEEVLPLWVRRLDTLKDRPPIERLGSGPWTRPIRGWLLQQLVKLGRCRAAERRPPRARRLGRRLAASLLSVLGRRCETAASGSTRARTTSTRRCRTTSAGIDRPKRLLGIEPADLPMPDFISSLVPWKRENAVALLEHIRADDGQALASRSGCRLGCVRVHPLRSLRTGRARHERQVSSSPRLRSAHDYYKRVPLTVPELDDVARPRRPGGDRRQPHLEGGHETRTLRRGAGAAMG